MMEKMINPEISRLEFKKGTRSIVVRGKKKKKIERGWIRDLTVA